MRFNKYKSLKQKAGGRVFAIGDVHGCLDKLTQLLDKIAFDSTKDQVVFTGDLIDRGAHSLDTLNFVLNKPYFHLVVGNHEHLFIEYILGKQAIPQDMMDYWINKDGQWCNELTTETLHKKSYDIIEQSSVIIEVRTLCGSNIGLTHAGFPYDNWFKPTSSYEDDYFGRLIWSRVTAETPADQLKPVKGVNYTVHGHTPVKHVLLKGNAVFIDTGCVSGGKLSALELTSLVFDGHLSETNVFSV